MNNISKCRHLHPSGHPWLPARLLIRLPPPKDRTWVIDVSLFFHSLSYYIRWLTRRFFISWINLFNPAEMSCLGSELTSLIIKWASEWLTRPVLIDRPLCRRQNSRQKFRLFFTLLGPCLSIITQFNTRWMPCKSDRRHLNIPLRAITHRHWLTTTAWMMFTRICGWTKIRCLAKSRPAQTETDFV